MKIFQAKPRLSILSLSLSVIGILLVAGCINIEVQPTTSTAQTTTTSTSLTTTTSSQACLQVLTPAYNPTTKECKTFKDSCIDAGWERGECPYASTSTSTTTPQSTTTTATGGTTTTTAEPSKPYILKVFAINNSGVSENSIRPSFIVTIANDGAIEYNETKVMINVQYTGGGSGASTSSTSNSFSISPNTVKNITMGGFVDLQKGDQNVTVYLQRYAYLEQLDRKIGVLGIPMAAREVLFIS